MFYWARNAKASKPHETWNMNRISHANSMGLATCIWKMSWGMIDRGDDGMFPLWKHVRLLLCQQGLKPTRPAMAPGFCRCPNSWSHFRHQRGSLAWVRGKCQRGQKMLYPKVLQKGCTYFLNIFWPGNVSYLYCLYLLYIIIRCLFIGITLITAFQLFLLVFSGKIRPGSLSALFLNTPK